MPNNEVSRDLILRARQLEKLAKKTGSELAKPKQLLEPGRLGELVSQGFLHMSGLAEAFPDNTEAVEMHIEQSLREATLTDGTAIVTSSTLPTTAVVFPETATVRHIPNVYQADKDTRFFVVGTTTDFQAFEDNSHAFTPNQGYKTRLGIIAPFIPRDLSSRIQHGGFLFHNYSGQAEVLDYQHLDEAKTQPLVDDEILIEANWYMDSENQDIVAARNNLQLRDGYNTFGLLYTASRPQYYTLNTYDESFKHLDKLAGLRSRKRRKVATVRELAAMSNVLARKVGATGWALGGLEYTYGGTYTTPLNPNRDHIAISYPQAV